MNGKTNGLHFLEVMFIAIVVGTAVLVGLLPSHSLVILNLFFLPIVASAFFFGRSHAGVLAFLCVLVVSIVIALGLRDDTNVSTVGMGLAVCIWGAALGLTSLLVGTLSDEREAKTKELAEAYIGVVQVFSQYLHGGDPRGKARSVRVAELSQKIGAEMKASPQEIEDIRVAALLCDVEDVEVTTRVISKAVGAFADGGGMAEHTFRGRDLAFSLATVIKGAMPLLVDPAVMEVEGEGLAMDATPRDMPQGTRIIEMARSYEAMADACRAAGQPVADDLLKQLRRDSAERDHQIVTALERVVTSSTGKNTSSDPPEPHSEI